MEKQLRTAIGNAAQTIRRALEEEYAEQLDGVYDIQRSGEIALEPGAHLSARQRVVRGRVISAIEYHRASAFTAGESVGRFVRDAAFTTLNRFVAIKMLEARQLVQPALSQAENSTGYREFIGLAPGVATLGDGAGYRIFLESLFDELASEIKVLFDRRDASSLLWPRRKAFEAILMALNQPALDAVWGDDETIGWFYQYFNSKEERQKMRDESQAPRNSMELAVRNQFFTPRYVVQFLVDNTLGRTWIEMTAGETSLTDRCEYFVALDEDRTRRPIKDPRDFKILDPACGSGHFLLYCFDLLDVMYREAWENELAVEESSGRSLRAEYATLASLERAIPSLIVERNLHGIDIDPRAAQIAALAVWLRAQRAWHDSGVDAVDRPRVRKTGIVIAEPMPGDPALVSDFARSLQPPLLSRLFIELVRALTLAGDMGTLLRAETLLNDEIARARGEFVGQRIRPRMLPGFEEGPEQTELDLSGIDDDDFFAEAEDRLLGALSSFVADGHGADSARRRLFAEDSAQGVALLELLRMRFDVVLMNPPFGEPIQGTFEWLRTHYNGYHNDLYASFFKRGVELAPHGRVGAITSRSYLLAPRLKDVRTELVAPCGEILLDLRQGVMDDAGVQAAAVIVDSAGRAQTQMVFLDGSDGRWVLPEMSPGVVHSLQTYTLDSGELTGLHDFKILYKLPKPLYGLLDGTGALEPTYGTAREGPKTFDNDRFLRLRWEVDRQSSSTGWVPFVKGGDYKLGVGPPHLVLKWHADGAELRAVNLALNGSTSQVRQASKYWFKSGAYYSKRSQRGFSARLLPEGCVFSSNGPAILPQSPEVSPARLLLWANCYPIRALMTLQSNFGDYSTGVIKKLPWSVLGDEAWQELESLLGEVIAQQLAVEQATETSPYFVSPLATRHGFSRGHYDRALEALDQRANAVISEALGLEDLSWAEDVLDPATGWREMSTTEEPSDADDRVALWRWAMGVVLGRFAVNVEGGQIHGDAVSAAEAVPTLLSPAESVRTDAPGIGVEDDGHPLDLAEAIVEVVERSCSDFDSGLASDRGAVRSWLRTRTFGEHLALYSASGRVAPVYWPLGTRSGSYRVWLYSHLVTADSLFRVGTDVVEPKLESERRRLSDLTQEFGPSPSASQRRTIEQQRQLVDELIEFQDELRALAPLWSPDLDDGVVIVLAPLWRLFAHDRSWSKELKERWVKLASGEYDWAQLAMRLWPERVIPKCAEDRSLAIAHGLEDVFWVADKDNRDKWHSRTIPTSPVEELIAARTFPTIITARRHPTP